MITPPESYSALSAALAQNPHLTSLPSPSPTVLAPESLTHETATAELLRLPEVQASIVGDFLLLPCDLICSLPGEMFLETWMGSQGGFGGTDEPKRAGLGAGQMGRQRGGLSVWYSTVDREESMKGEECDFCATAKVEQQYEIPLSRNQPDSRSSRGILRKLLWAMPMSTLKDDCDENRDHLWHIRSSLLAKYGSVKCLTRFRDAHIYLFPCWVKDFARLNAEFESVGEDLVGTWAKMDWRKPSYRARFHAKEVFWRARRSSARAEPDEVPIEEEIDLMSLSSTQVSRHREPIADIKSPVTLASRVTLVQEEKALTPDDTSPEHDIVESGPEFPPMLAYIHSSDPSSPLIRRIDSTPLLLSISLLLAKLPGLDDPLIDRKHSSPFSHASKISTSATIASRTTISKSDVLIGDNAMVSEKCVIKESVIGAAASVGTGCRITRCLIMDGATLGERCTLTDCVVGKKAMVGKNSTLQKCEVQDANMVPEKTEGKDEKYLVGGLEDEVDGDEALSFDDDDKGS